jgi:hypothetical protein
LETPHAALLTNKTFDFGAMKLRTVLLNLRDRLANKDKQGGLQVRAWALLQGSRSCERRPCMPVVAAVVAATAQLAAGCRSASQCAAPVLLRRTQGLLRLQPDLTAAAGDVHRLSKRVREVLAGTQLTPGGLFMGADEDDRGRADDGLGGSAADR